MRRYLIYGLSGSGKTTVGDELARRGHYVIETDNVPGLSSWASQKTGKKAKHNPPFTQEWLDEHVWIWDGNRLKEVLNDKDHEEIFFIGGAFNIKQFLELFDKKFALYVDSSVMKRRFQAREPERWMEDSPEIIRALEWNNEFVSNHSDSDTVLIDGSQKPSEIAEKILETIK